MAVDQSECCQALALELCVFRVARIKLNETADATNHGLEGVFDLSSTDKKSDCPLLSMWAEHLTLPDEAWRMMGSNPKNTSVACLKVGDIRGIADENGSHPLIVIWDVAVDANGNRVTCPEAKGHCGVSGLDHPNKKTRKLLRSKLADAAKLSRVPVPHNLCHEHIAVAAYYISLNSSHEREAASNWVDATRQLRRLHAHPQ